MAGARVVAEVLPGLEDVVLAGPCEGLHIGEALEKPLVVGDDGVDPGLLEHDLGNPGSVGIDRLAPGQVPLVCPVPVEQKLRDFLFDVSPHGDKILPAVPRVNRTGSRIGKGEERLKQV